MLISFEMDMPTVLLFLFLGNLVTAGLLAVYSSDSISYRSYRQFIAGKLLQSISWILLALRGKIPDVFSADVGNSLLLTGFALEALAVISVEKPRKQWETYYAIVVTVFIFIFWGFAKQPNQYVYISSTFAALMFFSVTIFFLHETKKICFAVFTQRDLCHLLFYLAGAQYERIFGRRLQTDVQHVFPNPDFCIDLFSYDHQREQLFAVAEGTYR